MLKQISTIIYMIRDFINRAEITLDYQVINISLLGNMSFNNNNL